MNFRMKASLFLLLAFCFWLLVANTTQAQSAPSLQGVSVNIVINDSDVNEGDIISTTSDGFKKSRQEHDPLVYGVVVASPILSIGPKSDATKSVLSSGDAQIRVSAKNGEIKEGDFITTSNEPGVGQKATKAGYIVGRALKGYNDQNSGLVAASVDIQYFGGVTIGGPLGGVATGLIGLIADPGNARYVLAAIVALGILITGDIAFIRLISTGIVAIGRNPLARSIILRSMIIAAFVIATLATIGLGAIIAIITIGR